MRTVVAFALGLCSVPQAGTACLAPVLNVPRLVSASDLIVVGKIVALDDAGPASVMSPDATGRTMAGVMIADAVLKGTSDSAEIRFRFIQPMLPLDCSHGAVSQGTYRILFLRAVNGVYEFASGYYPSVIATPSTPLPVADPLARVYHVLAAVLSSPDVSADDKRQAVYVLYQSGNDETRAALHVLAADPDLLLAGDATAALIFDNDLSILSVAERILSKPAVYPLEAVANVRGAIGEIKDARAVPNLARLVRSPDVETRRAAAYALRQSRSPAAIDALGAALEDDDLDVKYSAVAGLSEITGQTDGMPSIPLFRSNPEPYLARWKEWVRLNR